MIDLPAVILAAGKGTRLSPITDDLPKPMTEVNGTRIIDNLLACLAGQGFKKAVVVTGYHHRELEACLRPWADKIELVTVYNEVYGSTNNIYSLWLAREHLAGGFYLFEADIFFEPALLLRLARCSCPNAMALGAWDSRMEGTVVRLAADNTVTSMYLKKDQGESFDTAGLYKTVNFYRIGSRLSRDFFLPSLEEHVEKKHLNAYYELVIREALDAGETFEGVPAGDARWWEIDTPEDLAICEALFA